MEAKREREEGRTPVRSFAHNRWVQCCLREVSSSFAALLALLLLALLGTAKAQTDLGCCQFLGPAGEISARRCATLTQAQCNALRPLATFFRGQRCDSLRQRCVFQLGPTVAATPTSASTTSPTPSPTATPEPRGCCEVAASRAIPFPFCGNDVTASSCFESFGFRASFCPECSCSSHDAPGFFLAPGGCVRPSPTPTARLTVTPTRAPSLRVSPRVTLTPTPTATPASGCCEVPVSAAPGSTFFCGNDIPRSACLQTFPGAKFCPTCRCSSHGEAGFGTTRGRCVPLRATRPARPTRPAS
ncbi:hypothetical protein HRbin30_03025 [bacterium HR30]|nr:hypothetical protein HRbin30_03025 [bacterium HR30]